MTIRALALAGSQGTSAEEEVARWMADERKSASEARFLIDVISDRLSNLHARLSFQAAMASWSLAASAVFAAVAVVPSDSVWSRWLLGVALIGTLALAAVYMSLFHTSNQLIDEWTRRLLVVRAQLLILDEQGHRPSKVKVLLANMVKLIESPSRKSQSAP